jgi:tRNA pseudouridine55 synthase
MPKLVLPPLPLSGLFGIYKPSGPTSMSVVNDVKKLVANTRLFVEADKLKSKGNQPLKRRRMREAVKIGQGGTLDPLADGVLGENNQLITALVADIYIHLWRFQL